MTTTNPRLEWLQQVVGQPMGKHSLSPVGRWLNGTLTHIEPNKIITTHTVREDMTNPVGMLHGGISASMIDDAMGTLFFSLGLEFFFPTISLNLDYFYSAKIGEEVTTTAEVIRQGKTIIHLHAHITNPQGKILCKATSNLAVSGIKMPV